MKKYIGIIIAIGIFIFQSFLVHGAGMTWDEPASFFVGQQNLKFWLTGNRAYVDNLKDPALFPNGPFPYTYGEDLYPPVQFVVSAAFSKIFSEKLHMLSVIDANHIGELFIACIGVAAFYGIAIEVGLTGVIAAGTTLLYALYPTIVGEMRADAKDVPLMSMLVVFVYCFLRFVKSLERREFVRHMGWALVSGVTLGLSVATKPTAPIILVPLTIWFILSEILHKSFRKAVGPLGRFISLMLLVGLVALVGFFLAWPWIWDDPVGKLTTVWQFFRIVGLGLPVLYFGNTYWAGKTVPWSYPYVLLGTMTPIEQLILVLCGMMAVWWFFFKRGNAYALLPFFWFWVGILRFMIPGVVIYAKIRHFIDVMPAFFLFMGFGLEGIYTFLKKRTPSVIWIVPAVIIVAVLHDLFITARFYPFETSYFNRFIGGARTVAEKSIFDIDQIAGSIKEGMDYINTLPGNPSVYACDLTHLAWYYNRPGVTATPFPTVGGYVLTPNYPSWIGDAIQNYKKNQPLVHTVRRDGADLLYVFHNTHNYTWYCLRETDTVPFPGTSGLVIY